MIHFALKAGCFTFKDNLQKTFIDSCWYVFAMMIVMNKIITGNAAIDGRKTRSWIVGYFMPDDDIRRTNDVEIKWVVLKKGDSRQEWVTAEHRTTIVILVSGKHTVDFKDSKATLSVSGDYVMWGHGTSHKWHTDEDSVIITVRWPSIKSIN